jgi:uncharacterized protein DUF3551
MRTSLIVASLATALTALAGGVAPAAAEPVTNAYPYCLMGRGGGSTTCYFRTREECGNGCIGNPAYVGDARAHAILAGVGAGGASDRVRPPAKADRMRSPTVAATARGMRATVEPGVRASVADGFEGWPTGYLINRFGDRQAQGRF